MRRGRQDTAPKASYAAPPQVSAPEPASPFAVLTSRTPLLDAAIDHAVTIPSGAIRSHVDGLRRRNPEASPEQLIGLLTREYSFLLQGAGGAVGTAAVIPGIGTSVSIVLSTADVATFFTASSAYALAVAEVHGIEVHDTERRRVLLLAAVLGDSGAKAIAEVSGKPMAAWGTVLLTSMPTNTIRQVNKVLTGRFVKRMMVKQTSLALGRVIPFGIGAAVGILGGRALARTVVHQTGKAFGPPPTHFLTPVSEKSRGRADVAPTDPWLPGEP